MQPEDEFLQSTQLIRLRARDRAALEVEFAKHWEALQRAARRRGFTATEADDLTQTVWTRFLEVVPRFQGRSSVRTFLVGILRREASSARRRTRRFTPLESETLEAMASRSDAEQPRDLAHTVDRCMQELAAKERRAVELKLLQQQTEDAGRLLGVSANYLGVLLHRARAHLRRCLKEHLA